MVRSNGKRKMFDAGPGGDGGRGELENLDLSEGMDTGENADDGSLR